MAKKIRRLFRSQQSRIFGGVCGGMAEYFGMDPTWMRIIFILLILFGGIIILIYLILWIIIPLK
jgi:phage shock protein C